jgi:enamine deaminase RidA (YjgF/YER057c/UK114 family)
VIIRNTMNRCMEIDRMLHLFKRNKTIAIIALILSTGAAYAQSGFSDMNFLSEQIPIQGISIDELDQLKNNEIIISVLGSYKDIRLKSETDQAKAILGSFKKLRPNFLAEAFFVLPVEAGMEQAALIEVRHFLKSVKNFESIPYYSKQNETWTTMFEDINIQEELDLPDGSESITTIQKMLPFNPYTAVYQYSLSDGILEYKTFNMTPLYYNWMKGVKEEGMYTSILVQAHPGYLYFYGLGGARAFNFFGLFGNRLDIAFTGRIEAFFEWFHKEFVLSRLGEKEEIHRIETID